MPGNILDKIDIKDVCRILKESLLSIHPGTEMASDFHNLMIGIFELLLYPNLINPNKELEINEGRKRIDICFNNVSEQGFLFMFRTKLIFHVLSSLLNVKIIAAMLKIQNWINWPEDSVLVEADSEYCHAEILIMKKVYTEMF